MDPGARLAVRPLTATIHADVDLGLIDGSSVWLSSTADLLARAGCRVTLLLRAEVPLDALLLRPLLGRSEIQVVAMPKVRRSRIRTGRGPWEAVATLRQMHARSPADLVVVRGLRLAASLANEPVFAGRLWSYLTDVPQFVGDLDEAVLADLDAIARASRVVLCQTEELRSYLETVVPAMVGKTTLLPPAVPDPPQVTVGDHDPRRPLRLVYAGKLARRWKTLEMTSLPGRLTAIGIPAELHVVGDKIQPDPDDERYVPAMRAALEGTPGVVWHAGQSRDEAMRLTATGDLALSWRDESLDTSLELSTKILEAGSLGVPVVMNRTPMHERLFGRDYPLYASTADDLVAIIADAVSDSALRADAVGRVRDVAKGHTFERATDRLRDLLATVFPPPLTKREGSGSLRVGVAGFDLKFFTAILRWLRSLPDVEVRVDQWQTMSRHDPSISQATVDWADVLICEWCGPNAVWYSHHRRPGQRLIVRLHRYELERAWPAGVDIERVDRVVCVSDAYAIRTSTVTGWPADKIVTIPNCVDDGALDRAKLEGAEFHLGFIGMAPMLKRLDRALDVLERLRRDDPRFRLFVKSKLPWDYPGIWQREDERAYVEALMRRIQTTRILRDAVVFDAFGPDVASWLRRIGFVLSTSDGESFHLAIAEGMASGAVPCLIDWPGADTIYDRRWIHRSTDAMAVSIASMVHEGSWEAERAVARAQARDAFGLARVCDAWGRLIVGAPSGAIIEPSVARAE